jgi:enolase
MKAINQILSVTGYKTYNSHLESTNEFAITLDNGVTGLGASPQGETISIYEDQAFHIDPQNIIISLESDGILKKEIDQQSLDTYLRGNVVRFGKNNVFALSLAFFNAQSKSSSLDAQFMDSTSRVELPCICFNILNGGWHAYTNPVLSDFPEYLLVAKTNDLETTIDLFREVFRVVKERLLQQKKTVVAGNVVHIFKSSDNRECLDFLLDVCQQTGASAHFDLMIDASATDLWKDSGYRLAVTGQGFYSRDQFLEYWLKIIADYDLRFLEDPFFETDYENWQRLTASQQTCAVIGDNFYTTDAEKILEGVDQKYTHGVIIKPNQAGTVTDVHQALAAAKNAGQIAITSHRSVSTESTFLSTLTYLGGAPYIKIGPLLTDYSSIIRLNELIRIEQRLSSDKPRNNHLYNAARAHRL